MTPQAVISECSSAGVSIHLNGNSIRLRGTPDAVKIVSDVIRQHKAALIEHLATAGTADLVREFMEIDGLSLEEAKQMATVSIPIRPAAEWTEMIAELDALIERYCTTCRLSSGTQARILAVRNRQSLASIPATLAWFKTELKGMQ
jgi:hypothetical protein